MSRFLDIKQGSEGSLLMHKLFLGHRSLTAPPNFNIQRFPLLTPGVGLPDFKFKVVLINMRSTNNKSVSS